MLLDQILKYERFSTLGCKDKGIHKIKARTQVISITAYFIKKLIFKKLNLNNEFTICGLCH